MIRPFAQSPSTPAVSWHQSVRFIEISVNPTHQVFPKYVVRKTLPFHKWLTTVLTYLRSAHNSVITAIMKIYYFNDFFVCMNYFLEIMLRNKLFVGELKRLNNHLP